MATRFKSPTKGPSITAKDEITRRGLAKSENATTPITPPARYISSNFSSPGSAFGKEDDAIIIELTPRYLKAGIEGESHAQCRYDFRPTNGKRLGDYRQWLPGYVPQREKIEDWGREYELWRNDLRDVSLGLLSDKLERAVREVYNKNLLVDTGNARLILVVPSLLPHPVLAEVLQTLFERWSIPSVVLLPTPVTALVAAGLRSGLVVDIGWEETVVTAVYEYREVRAHRTTRAVKALTRDLAAWIQQTLSPEHHFNLEIVESVLKRVVTYALQDPVGGVAYSDETEPDSDADDHAIQIEWPTNDFTKAVDLKQKELQASIHGSLLGKHGEERPDDEELPIPRLMYDVLLMLPTDVRGTCLSRIVFIGEGAETYGLQSVLMTAFTTLLESRGWNGVQGGKPIPRRKGLTGVAQIGAQPADVKHDDVVWSEKVVAEERYIREKVKHTQPSIHGVVRQVETLGSWVGASLLANLKVKSFVEVQRERFLSHGLAGASKESDSSTVSQNRMNMLGIRSKPGERTSWTLSGWG